MKNKRIIDVISPKQVATTKVIRIPVFCSSSPLTDTPIAFANPKIAFVKYTDFIVIPSSGLERA